MAIIRNTAGQGLYIYAHDTAADEPETGDAANITATLSLDGGVAGALTDVNPDEIGGGVYWFDLTQAETNAAALSLIAVSVTADVQIDPVLVLTQEVGIDTRAVAGDAMTLEAAERTTLAAVFLTQLLEGAHTVGDGLRIMLAALAGKSTGGGTFTNRFRDVADGKNRIDATVDANGDRLAITIDGTP